MKTFYLVFLGVLSHLSLYSQAIQLDSTIGKLDSIVQASMEARQIAGSSYAIVKGDSIYASKSFGYANLEEKVPLTNDHRHMFGSVSKLITATLVLQLVEEGKLDLDEDIKTYIPYFELKYPTTLHHLLTHTAGFEEQGLDRTRRQGSPYEPLKDYLIRKMPKQIAPPGEMAAYSNHGIALAGLVAQEVEGIPFEELVKERVLKPANMQTAEFNFTEDFLAKRATPYINMEPAELQYVQTVPASMLMGTIKDLANFMIMQLNPHQYDPINTQAILRMQSTQFQPNEQMYGRGFGFFERVFRGKMGLNHGNTRRGYFSLLYIIPSDTLGIVVTATGNQTGFRDDVVFGFLRLLYPKLELSPPIPKEMEQELSDMISGSYFSMRTNETKTEKLIYKSRPQEAKVTVEGEKVHVFGQTFIYIGNHTFEEENGGALIAFKKSSSGVYLMMRGRADFYKKTSWYNHPTLHIILLSAMVLVFLVLLIISLLAYFKRETDISQKMVLGANFVATVFLLGFILVTVIKGEDLQYGIPTIFYPIFVLPIIFVLLYLILLGYSLRNKMFAPKRMLYLLLGGLFCVELFFWNFVGWNF